MVKECLVVFVVTSVLSGEKVLVRVEIEGRVLEYALYLYNASVNCFYWLLLGAIP